MASGKWSKIKGLVGVLCGSGGASVQGVGEAVLALTCPAKVIIGAVYIMLNDLPPQCSEMSSTEKNTAKEKEDKLAKGAQERINKLHEELQKAIELQHAVSEMG